MDVRRLRSGELVVSRWGPLWDAVATSFAIPVLGPAQIRGRAALGLVADRPLREDAPHALRPALGHRQQLGVPR